MADAHSLPTHASLTKTNNFHSVYDPDLSGLLPEITDFLDSNKADNIVTLSLIGKTSFADAMIIATGRSPRHMAALADNLADFLAERGIRDITIEGQGQCDWVLIDAGAVIVHLFRAEIRDFYNLEKMWGDAFPLQS